MKTTYIIGSAEGVTFATDLSEPGAKVLAVGDKVTLEIDDSKELAVLAAGWLTSGDTGTKGGAK